MVSSALISFFVCVRKISPELTSVANPPLLAEEDWAWANIVPVFLYFTWDAATAWLDKRCVGARLGSEPANPGPPQQSACT